jgi:hypothetical protein
MNYTLTYDQWISALCLWREARSATLPAIAGIYHVILNRSQDPHNRWPKTIPGVICQHLQFSSFNAGDPNAVKFPMPPASSGGAPTADWTAWLNCVVVVTAPLGADPVGGATNYYSLRGGLPNIPPAWADPAKKICEIGVFQFYKL